VDLFVLSGPWNAGHSPVFWASAVQPDNRNKKQILIIVPDFINLIPDLNNIYTLNNVQN
jgi:hypothetical protein